MVICKNCGMITREVMSFSKDKQERFQQCPRCYSETRHIPIKKEELNFGEVLHKIVNQHK